MSSLKNATIVTGAHSGVGLETTRQLVRQGGHVIMACRRPEAAREFANAFTGLNSTYFSSVMHAGSETNRPDVHLEDLNL